MAQDQNFNKKKVRLTMMSSLYLNETSFLIIRSNIFDIDLTMRTSPIILTIT